MRAIDVFVLVITIEGENIYAKRSETTIYSRNRKKTHNSNKKTFILETKLVHLVSPTF